MDTTNNAAGSGEAMTLLAGSTEPRDNHFGGSSYEASMLRDLLARIHGDGGHYLAEHGLEKALEDGHNLVAAWRSQPTRSEQVALVKHLVQESEIASCNVGLSVSLPKEVSDKLSVTYTEARRALDEAIDILGRDLQPSAAAAAGINCMSAWPYRHGHEASAEPTLYRPFHLGSQNDALFIISGRAPALNNDYPNHDADRTCVAKVVDEQEARRIVDAANKAAGAIAMCVELKSANDSMRVALEVIALGDSLTPELTAQHGLVAAGNWNADAKVPARSVGHEVWINYTNYRGVRTWRHIAPRTLTFGRTVYHPNNQWMLEAWDCDKQALRGFAVKDIHAWSARKPDADAELAPASSNRTPALDDPRLQELFSSTIDGALTSGYQGVAPAPSGSWLETWWRKGRDVAEHEASIRAEKPAI